MAGRPADWRAAKRLADWPDGQVDRKPFCEHSRAIGVVKSIVKCANATQAYAQTPWVKIPRLAARITQ